MLRLVIRINQDTDTLIQFKRTESLKHGVTRTEDVMETHWLLTSFSRMVEKSMGFLMTFRYPGTDLRLTGVRKGQAS